MYQQFQHSFSGSLEEGNVSALSTSTFVFNRVWTSKDLDVSRLNAVSIWRPVPPPGFVAVGDCIAAGTWTAPRSAVVLQKGADGGLTCPAVVRTEQPRHRSCFFEQANAPPAWRILAQVLLSPCARRCKMCQHAQM